MLATNTAYIASGFQNTFGGGYSDGYLVKFTSSGQRLSATYYGGAMEDGANACTEDRSNNVYLAGYTRSNNNIATPNGFQTFFYASLDAMLVKFDSSGNRIWGTYYGGSDIDNRLSCSTDRSGNIFVWLYLFR